jgi:catechol 2,3-dioxygenase-like lactoylglutathione lyase family enzyme
MIGKGTLDTHLVVPDAAKSVEFYTGLFGMEQLDFKDGTLVVLTKGFLFY